MFMVYQQKLVKAARNSDDDDNSNKKVKVKLKHNTYIAPQAATAAAVALYVTVGQAANLTACRLL